MRHVVVFASLALAAPLLADEGQWMPEQILDLDPAMLAAKGLELRPDELWKPGNKGLLGAVVNLSGCSAAFVSKDGLVATNHHCGYGAVQAASTPENDYLTEGFLAKTKAEEIEAKQLTVKVLRGIEDVTKEVRAVLTGDDDEARAKAAEKKQKELVAACEKSGEHRCQVASFYHGALFKLFTYVELKDIRVVFAPPSSIGNYGGEIDNWMWPRHSGDFTLVRAYVGKDGKPAPYAKDNVPYRPAQFLELEPAGVGAGDYVSTIGYPGHTDRYLPAVEVERHLKQVFPGVIDLFGEWIRVQEDLLSLGDEVRIKTANRRRRLANVHKNSRGMVDGITRMKLLARRQAEDAALKDLAKTRGLTDGLAALDDMSATRGATWERDYLFRRVHYSADTLGVAVDLVRRHREGAKPDLERERRYMKRNEDKLWQSVERHLRDFHPKVDVALLESTLRRMRGFTGVAAIAGLPKASAVELIGKTKLSDKALVKSLFFEGDLAKLRALGDPMIALAEVLVPVMEAAEATGRARTGRMLVDGPVYFDLLKQVRKGPIYPDANGTLRFSYASVMGYAPKDGLIATTHTTVAGQAAKHTGEKPFDLPAKVRAKVDGARSTPWADPDLGDVPVCFLSSSDTTGGNSGSPVVDGRGRLVGFNFDRVWENIAGDFGYHIARSRNISVDVRYLLWTLDQVFDAGALLEELGVAHLRGKAPPKRPGRKGLASPAKKPVVHKQQGCSSTSTSDLAWAALGLVALAGCRRRRRRR